MHKNIILKYGLYLQPIDLKEWLEDRWDIIYKEKSMDSWTYSTQLVKSFLFLV